MSLIYEHNTSKGIFQTYSQKPDIPFTKVKQIHSEIIVKSQQELSQCEADGIISLFGETHFNLCIVTADCLPIYICGEKGIAMLHAGWQGLKKKIILNSKIKNLNPQYALIGPHICQNHYQVGAEFLQYFENSKCLIPDKNQANKYKLSLEQEASYQLKKLNPDITIESSSLCTFEHKELHSYRSDSTMSRNWNIFVYRD